MSAIAIGVPVSGRLAFLPMPDTPSAGLGCASIYSWGMNEWQKLGRGQGVRNDRFWVGVTPCCFHSVA